MNYSIRPGMPSDLPEIKTLLPRLAAFDVPTYRVPEYLWHGDRDLIISWASGNRDDVHVAVAIHDNTLVGVAALTLGKELLSHQPSAHLELLAISSCFEGAGIGSALMQEAESIAQAKGAQSISLHVFSNNTRARSLYERHGYNGELMRYFKPLV